MNEHPDALGLLDRAKRLIDESCPPDHSPLTTAQRDIREARAFFAELVRREAELAGVVVALHEAISTFSITNQGATEAGAVDTVGFLLKYATRALDRRAGPQEQQA